MVLLADPRIAAVPVHDCGEPLVDLREWDGLLVDGRQADPDGAYARLRVGAAGRLVRASGLLPPSWQLVLVEGFRPAHLQRRYFDEYVDFLVSRNPAWSWPTLRQQASRYISPPEVAPHTTGGAVDVTVMSDDRPLWMGSEVNAAPEECNGACVTDAPALSPETQHRREMLRRAMTGAGFVNYPTEWWHWSYGDRYWAYVTGTPAAHYGPIIGDQPQRH